MNPLMSKTKLPGRIFQLPSKGLFYSPGTILDPRVKDGEIQVKPLSALAEMKFRSPDLLFNGRALREICEECIPDILNPEGLLSKDVDALFCFLKISTYGDMLTAKVSHECKPLKIHSYNIDLSKIVNDPRNESLKFHDISYTVVLTNGMKVNLRPITFKDALDVTHIRIDLERKFSETSNPDSELLEKMIIRDIMSGIDSVETEPDENGVRVRINDRVMIEEWVRTLQKTFFNEINDQLYKANDWGYKLIANISCKECSHEFEYPLEMNPINFFSG